MKQLCIFTAPKPFRDPHITTIQRNALGSWLALGDAVDIVLVGNDQGIAEAAAEFGVKHVPTVAVNSHGTPLVSAIFDAARQNSDAAHLVYVNADIIFYPGLVETVQKVAAQVKDFVLLGRRYDMNITQPLEFTAGWDARLRAEMHAHGQLHTRGGSDYFAFPRQLYTDMPPFAIGRAGWDNWMMYEANRRNWHAVDSTAEIDIVHQNHDYSHLQGEHGHQRHVETDENTMLGGGMRSMYMLLDVPYELVNGKVRRAPWSAIRALRSVERMLQPNAIQDRGLRWRIMRQVRNLRFALGGR
ncbi:MAG: hypothetical protein KF698_09445 [Anaerolineales bacterium]|nr:hypothetical protein [Anaerolineales bacterium]